MAKVLAVNVPKAGQKYTPSSPFKWHPINIPSTNDAFQGFDVEICPMFLRWLMFSHLWIALGASVTTWLTLSSEGTSSLTWPVWVGASTGLGYALQRFVKHRQDREAMPPMRRSFWDNHAWRMLAGWGTAWLGWTAIHWETLNLIERWDILGLLVIMGTLYAVFPGSSQGLRQFAVLKIPLIATAWALATTVLPFDNWSPEWFASRWLLVAGLSIPFDLRDVEVDQTRIRTFPMLAGPHATLWVAGLACLLSIGPAMSLPWISIMIPSVVLPGALGAVLMMLPQTQADLLSQDEERREIRCGLWIDGALVMPLLASFVPHFLP